MTGVKDTGDKFITGVKVSGNKFMTGFVDTGHKSEDTNFYEKAHQNYKWL